MQSTKETKNTKTMTETCRVQRKQKIQRCSEPRVQQNSTAVDQTATIIPRTRESAGSRRKQTVTRKNVCSRQNCQPRVTFDTTKPDARTTFNKDGEKHGQREILESRDIRQVPNKRRVEVQSQNRDSLIRDVCTCLALRRSCFVGFVSGDRKAEVGYGVPNWGQLSSGLVVRKAAMSSLEFLALSAEEPSFFGFLLEPSAQRGLPKFVFLPKGVHGEGCVAAGCTRFVGYIWCPT